MFNSQITVKESTDRFIEKLRQIDPDIKVTLIKKAYQFSWHAHKDQKRKSGEPFLAHPVAVSFILAEQKLDPETIAAGLLHDVIEDTPISFEELKEKFGETIALLVDGVTKIDKFQAQSSQHRQAETYRKMLLSMSKDLRVIIIKFADRLHNLRTLRYLSDKKIKLIAQETLDIYAPLAHRLGMARIKWELEDLAFKYLYPKEHQGIVANIVDSRHEREQVISSFIGPVRSKLQHDKVKATVVGRPKHFYSIYRKMVHRQVPFREIFDLLAIRVITDTPQQCYQILGIIHSLYKPIHEKFKDYIGTPKSNGYQSLHTAVVGPNGKIIEVQIRTWEMHQTAEDGVAAHWLYKDNKNIEGPSKDDQAISWLRNLIEWQKELTDSTEFYEFFKVDLFHAEIFVFTPKGDLFTLHKGATVLDFAFAVHTELGLHCIGARVDGKIQPNGKEIKSGSTVEILHLSEKSPTYSWLRDARTPKARSAIKRWLNHRSKEDSIELGKKIVRSQFKKLHVSSTLKDWLPALLEHLNVSNIDTLYQLVGRGKIPISRITQFLSSSKIKKPMGSRVSRLVDSLIGRDHTITVGDTESGMIRCARCCNPLPGDEIIGFLTNGRGIVVHRIDCPNSKIFESDDEHCVHISWENEADIKKQFIVFIDIAAHYRDGLLKDITTILNEYHAEVMEGHLSRNSDKVLYSFQLKIGHGEQLKEFTEKLSKVNGIDKVTRTRDKRQYTQEHGE